MKIDNSNLRGFIYLVSAKGLSTVGNLLFIPVALKVLGNSTWLMIVTMQALATILSPLVLMFWNKFGPIINSANSPEQEQAVINRAILQRLLMAILVTVSALSILTLLPGIESKILLSAAFTSTIFSLLSNEWLYVSKLSFKNLLLNESIPRFLASVAPLFFLSNVTQVTIYFFMMSMISLITFLLKYKNGTTSEKVEYLDPFSVSDKLRYVFLQFVGFLILFSPVPLINILDYSNKFEFTFMERFFRMFMTLLIPISQYAHGQLLNTSEFKETVRRWIKNMRFINVLIIILFTPLSMAYILISNQQDNVTKMLPIIIGVLFWVVTTFQNRIVEEVFVLETRNIKQFNGMQVSSTIMLSSLVAISAVFRNSLFLLGALILTEMYRYLYMVSKIDRYGNSD